MKFENSEKYEDYLFDKIEISGENILEITIFPGIVGKTPPSLIIEGRNILENSTEIISDIENPIKINFNKYFCYMLRREETYTGWDKELWDGKNFRTYSKSNYFEYIKNNCIIIPQADGELKHYGIACIDFFIDVISGEPPIIWKK